MKILCIIALILSCSLGLSAQDAQFSQNQSNPLSINPALTGLINGDVRIAAAYRNERQLAGTSPYRTFAASADGKLIRGFGENNWLSAGLVFLTDKAGTVALKTTTVDFSLAYNLTFDVEYRHHLSAGLSAGFSQKSIDLTEIVLNDASETVAGSNASYTNVGAGLMYYYTNSSREYWYLGIASNNLSEPTISFNGAESTVGRRWSAQAGLSWPVLYSFDVVPSVYFLQQSGFYKVDFGSYFRWILFEPRDNRGFTAISLGSWLRLMNNSDTAVHGNALILAARLEWNALTTALSYDLALSSGAAGLKPNRGTLELTLTYELELRPKQSIEVMCPKF